MQQDGDEEEKCISRWKVARLSLKAGMLHSTMGQLDTAEQLLRNALGIVRRSRVPFHPEAASTGGLGESRANRVFFDLMTADILRELGLVLARKRDLGNALNAMDEAKHILEQAGKKPSHSKIKKIVSDAEEIKKLEVNRNDDEPRQTPANDEGSIDDRSIDFDALDALDEYEAHFSLSTSMNSSVGQKGCRYVCG